MTVYLRPDMAAAPQFNLHDHVGFLCGQIGNWRRVVFPFLAQGLARGERCVYLTSLHTPRLVESLLAELGVDLPAVKARRQFLLLDASRYYLERGWFDPDRVILKNQAAVRLALGEGFAGLRAVSEMAWAAYQPRGWQDLREYERRLNQEVFAGMPMSAICLYDQLLFDPAQLEMVGETHPLLIDQQGRLRQGGFQGSAAVLA